MVITSHTLESIRRMTIREFKLCHRGAAYWRATLGGALGGCALG